MKTIDIKAEILKLKETRSIKEIASDMGLSASTLYKYLRGPVRFSIEENSKEYEEINWKSFRKIYKYLVPPSIPANVSLYFSSRGYEFKVYTICISAGHVYRFMLIRGFNKVPKYLDSIFDDIMDDNTAHIHEESDLKLYANQLAFVEDYEKNFNIVYK